ncbi:class I SAM-dependent methyltransferase [Ktedonosporobacter rubrisoli]|uniref:Class I SAM-dependent methyltransferase n=1 Tax=Ktedonosporobacter rubrisoli TaxID=2509675 RepID=A0A4P6JK82_KTERU|nr:class I SAM-dependent methyltransferase [Ktedonosporobacter rubrisoli]QBD75555.1 class I SAM-dependent methyltransferase [Ktedonosporobacter rubrisoli]
MKQPSTHVDFDKNPPMPLDAYVQTVRSVNIGYNLTFQLTASFLCALGKPDLHILVVGAGGGAEVERFLPHNPGWKITGVDPSQQMLALAQAKVDQLKLADRVTLLEGTVEQLKSEARFDAATCLYVLHFLPDAAKLSLLRSIKDHLQPGAPLYLISGVRPDTADIDMTNPTLSADFQGAWRQYGESMGMPAERMASIVAGLTEQMSRPEAATAARVQELVHEAGFTYAAPFCSILGSMYCWVVR